MFLKLTVTFAICTIVFAAPQHLPAAQYPAGVNPHDCPNFPICDNARLHNPQPQWGGAPSWHSAPAPAPQWNPNWGSPAPAPAPQWTPNWGSPAPAGGDKYPAGVNPHSCPNYPFCDVNAGQHGPVAAPPLPGYTERLYPAGVSPHECPNFPYCH